MDVPEGLELVEREDGLTLVGDGMELRCDFARLLPRLRPGRLSRELLVRAARCRGVAAPVALDATAGLGEDSLLLAAAGFTVLLCESDPVIYALLADGLLRSARDLGLAGPLARMRAMHADSLEVLAGLADAACSEHADAARPERIGTARPSRAGAERPACGGAAGLTGEAACPSRAGAERPACGGAAGLTGEAVVAHPDVVYLDPMFPQRTKSAAVKKKFQLLQRLEPPCEQPEELLRAALATRPRKVVVKRPIKAAPLAGARPSHSLCGKAIRYDVYLPS